MEPLEVDNSILSSVAHCSTQALVRYVLGYTSPAEQAALRAGSAFHEAMAAWWLGANAAACLAVFEEHYRAFAEQTVEADDRLAWDNLRRIVAYWFESHRLAEMPVKLRSPELVEIGFRVPLTPEGECICGHPATAHSEQDGQPADRTAGCVVCVCPGYQPAYLIGRLDALVDLHGSPYVWENKTTGRINDVWLSRWRSDSQLTGYVEAARISTGVPVVGVIINAVEFCRLPSSDRRCQRHAVRYDECGHLHAEAQLVTVGRTPEQVAEWRKTALHLARRFRELKRWADVRQTGKVRTQGTFNNTCPWCAFQVWCEAGRRPDDLLANFVHSPWHPLNPPTARKP